MQIAFDTCVSRLTELISWGRAEPKTTTAQELVDLENEAEARRLKLFEAAKAIKIQLRDQERRASEGLLRAKQAVDKARIKVKLAKVAMIKAADPLNAIRDEKACKQVPECLKEKRAAGGCSVDKFPISTCLKAKKGEVKLCSTSELVQKNCCATCMLNTLETCQKVLRCSPRSPSTPPPLTPPTTTKC